MLNKVSKTIGLLLKLQKLLPRPPLITIYKTLIRPYLDYGDIVNDQAFNVSFIRNSSHYKAALANTGAIKRTSREKFYHELVFESLETRRWYEHAFIKFSRLSHLGIYSTLFLQLKEPILQEMMICYLISKQNRIVSKILSSL